MRIKTTGVIVLFLAALTIARAGSGAEEKPTVIEISDSVKVKDCKRFGVNVSHGLGLLKKPFAEDFEGMFKDIGEGTYFFYVGEVYKDGFRECAGSRALPESPEDRKKYFKRRLAIQKKYFPGCDI